jgi:hypothetical protein
MMPGIIRRELLWSSGQLEGAWLLGCLISEDLPCQFPLDFRGKFTQIYTTNSLNDEAPGDRHQGLRYEQPG